MGALPLEVPVKDLPGSRGNSLSLKETRSDRQSWSRGQMEKGYKFQRHLPDSGQVILFLRASVSTPENGVNDSAFPTRPVPG